MFKSHHYVNIHQRHRMENATVCLYPQLVISAAESLQWQCEEENNDTRHHDHRHWRFLKHVFMIFYQIIIYFRVHAIFSCFYIFSACILLFMKLLNKFKMNKSAYKRNKDEISDWKKSPSHWNSVFMISDGVK